MKKEKKKKQPTFSPSPFSRKSLYTNSLITPRCQRDTNSAGEYARMYLASCLGDDTCRSLGSLNAVDTGDGHCINGHHMTNCLQCDQQVTN